MVPLLLCKDVRYHNYKTVRSVMPKRYTRFKQRFSLAILPYQQVCGSMS